MEALREDGAGAAGPAEAVQSVFERGRLPEIAARAEERAQAARTDSFSAEGAARRRADARRRGPDRRALETRVETEKRRNVGRSCWTWSRWTAWRCCRRRRSDCAA